MDDQTKYELIIVKWLFKLSLKYPSLNDEFYIWDMDGSLRGVENVHKIVLYGHIDTSSDLAIQLEALEIMMSDKPKRFIYHNHTPSTEYMGNYIKLKDVFDEFRQELRDIQIDNLLN